MKYDAICFDLDGVIIDSESLHEAAFGATLKSYNLSLSPNDYQNFFAGKTDQQGFRDYLVYREADLPLNELLERKQESYAELAPSQLKYYEGMPELIKSLSSVSVLALVTGSTLEETELALRGRDLRQYFAVVVTADDIVNSKPSPEGYLLAAKELGGSIVPQTCLVVEDSPSGIRAANSAGMYCVAVSTTHPPESLRAADLVVDKLSFDIIQPLIHA